MLTLALSNVPKPLTLHPNPDVTERPYEPDCPFVKLGLERSCRAEIELPRLKMYLGYKECGRLNVRDMGLNLGFNIFHLPETGDCAGCQV